MIYTVKWNDDPDYAYHVELTQEQFVELQDRMAAAEDIESFSILPLAPTVNAYVDILETLEDWGV